MASKPKVTNLNAIAFVHQNVVGFDISMNNSMPMKVGIDTDKLICDFALISIRKNCFSAMEKIVKSALLH